MHAASFGLSVVLGNWVVTLLERTGGESEHVAGLIGGLVLFVGVVSRPLGGRLVDRMGVLRRELHHRRACSRRARAREACAADGRCSGRRRLRSRHPVRPRARRCATAAARRAGAAIGAVNMVAATVILVGTPLLGLTFSLPGGGRAAFLVVAVL